MFNSLFKKFFIFHPNQLIYWLENNVLTYKKETTETNTKYFFPLGIEGEVYMSILMKELNGVILTIILPFNCPENKINIMCRTLTLVQYGLRYGSFDMDMKDGQILFRISNIEINRIGATVLDNLLVIAYATVMKYAIVIKNVIETDILPEILIEEVENT